MIVPRRLSSGSGMGITPSRTVAICGRWFGVMMVAMMLPPKAGRVWCRWVVSGSIASVRILSGVSSATFSISIPPSVEAYVGEALGLRPVAATQVIARDRHCRFPGCRRPARWCDAHHIIHWLDLGPTDLDNLIEFDFVTYQNHNIGSAKIADRLGADDADREELIRRGGDQVLWVESLHDGGGVQGALGVWIDAAAQLPRDMGCHIHAAESQLDLRVSQAAYGAGPVQRLAEAAGADKSGERRRADADDRREVMAKLQTIMTDEGVTIQPYWRSLYRHAKPGFVGWDMHIAYLPQIYKIGIAA